MWYHRIEKGRQNQSSHTWWVSGRRLTGWLDRIIVRKKYRKYPDTSLFYYAIYFFEVN